MPKQQNLTLNIKNEQQRSQARATNSNVSEANDNASPGSSKILFDKNNLIF